MESETMITSMGGSMKESMYRGALGPPMKSLEKASQQLALFGQVAAFDDCCIGAGPLGPA